MATVSEKNLKRNVSRMIACLYDGNECDVTLIGQPDRVRNFNDKGEVVDSVIEHYVAVGKVCGHTFTFSIKHREDQK